MDRQSTRSLEDELNALKRSGALDQIGESVARAEAIVSELLRRTEREPGDHKGNSSQRAVLLERRAELRATLGSRGTLRWLTAAAEDYAHAARLTARSSLASEGC